MQDWFNDIGAYGNVTGANAYRGQTMNFYTGGSLYMRTPVRNYPLASITPPSFRAGCGGIDLYAGSFSFINKDQFVALLRNIGNNAIGAAVDYIVRQTVGPLIEGKTPKQIEMVWVEKKPTGLPPKPFVLDVDVSPRIRYLMPSGTAASGSSGLGTIRMEGLSAFSREDTPPSAEMADSSETTVRALAVEDKPATEKGAAIAPPPPTNMPEASVLRMLFGNHAGQKSR